MLKDKLKDWLYYKRKIPLYMQSSNGITEQFAMVHGLLLHLDNLEEATHATLSVLAIDVNKCRAGETSELAKLNADMLNKVGSMFNIPRKFKITYIKDGSINSLDFSNGLSDLEYLRLLQIKILNLVYDGSYRSSRDAYDSELEENVLDIPIYMVQGSNSAECNVYLIVSGDTSKDFTENEQLMFLAGIYTPVSLGISYNFYIADSNIGVWDYNSGKGQWDVATWG